MRKDGSKSFSIRKRGGGSVGKAYRRLGGAQLDSDSESDPVRPASAESS